MQKRFLTRRESAEYLTAQGAPTTFHTLQKFATTGGGPVYQLLGNRSVYRPEDLDAWIEARLTPPRRSTSDDDGDKAGEVEAA